jgi:hypothetical protein
MWTHGKDEHPVARKTYQCRLCGGSIHKGHRHVRRFGYDSAMGPIGLRMHDQCESASREMTKQDWETMDECTFRSECLGIDLHGNKIDASLVSEKGAKHDHDEAE